MFAMLVIVIMLDRLLQVDNQYQFGHTNLDRGKADAWCIVHCLEHVIDELFELGRVEFRHGMTNLLKDGITVFDNLSQHGSRNQSAIAVARGGRPRPEPPAGETSNVHFSEGSRCS